MFDYYKIKVRKSHVLEDLTQALEYYSKKHPNKIVELYVSYYILSWVDEKCPEMALNGSIKSDLSFLDLDAYVLAYESNKDKLGGLIAKSAYPHVTLSEQYPKVLWYDPSKVEYNPQLGQFTTKDSIWEKLFGWLR